MVQTAVNSAVEALNLLVKCAKNYHMLPQKCGCGRDIMGMARVWFIKMGVVLLCTFHEVGNYAVLEEAG